MINTMSWLTLKGQSTKFEVRTQSFSRYYIQLSCSTVICSLKVQNLVVKIIFQLLLSCYLELEIVLKEKKFEEACFKSSVSTLLLIYVHHFKGGWTLQSDDIACF